MIFYRDDTVHGLYVQDGLFLGERLFRMFGADRDQVIRWIEDARRHRSGRDLDFDWSESAIANAPVDLWYSVDGRGVVHNVTHKVKRGEL